MKVNHPVAPRNRAERRAAKRWPGRWPLLARPLAPVWFDNAPTAPPGPIVTVSEGRKAPSSRTTTDA